jgi:hypothetical protein
MSVLKRSGVVIMLMLSGLGVAASTPTTQPVFHARLDLYAAELEVGEPLVATVTITNTGPDTLTAYARPGAFRDVSFRFVVEQGTQQLLQIEAPSSGGRTVMPDPRYMAFERIRRSYTLLANSRRQSQKVVPLVVAREGMQSFLGPGEYEVRARFSLDDVSYETSAQLFRIRELPPERRAMLEPFTPALVSLLEGRWGRPTEQMLEVGARLRELYRNAPHRVCLEYRLLENDADDVTAYRVAAKQYLEEFPGSPFVGDLLWHWAHIEIAKDDTEAAEALLARLVKEFPMSPLHGEAQEKLHRLRQKQGGDQEG